MSKYSFSNYLMGLFVLLMGSPKSFCQSTTDTAVWSINLTDIVVTAQYIPTDSRNALQEIKAIRQEVIEQRGATNLEQLLTQEASIRIRQDLVLGSSMSLLGIDGQNVKIMIDEVPVIGRQGGNIDLSQLNLQNIASVEIVEGPLSVNYGTNALAGVINLVTKKTQVKKQELSINTQYETRGENRLSLNYGNNLSEKLLLKLNTAFDKFDGPDNDTLRSSVWNPKEQWSLDGSLNYALGKDQNLRYAFSYFDETVTNLGAVRRPQFKPYAFDDYYQTERINHTLNFKGGISKNYYLQSTVAFNQFLRQKNTYRNNFETALEELVTGQQDTSTFNALMWRSTVASRNTKSPFNFQLGLDLRYDNATGKRIQDDSSEKASFSFIGDYAAFASLRYTGIPKLQVETGLRYAVNTRYNAPLIPSLQAKYELGQNWTARASYGKGFRSPDLKELFFRFIDINHFIVGNPDLRAEQSDNFQVGVIFNKIIDNQKISTKLKGFHNNIQEKITLFEYIDTPEGFVPAIEESTGQFAYFNQAIYKTQGLTANLNYQAKNWELGAGYSLIGYYNDLHQTITKLDKFTYTNELSGNIAFVLPEQAMRFSLFLRKNDRLLSFYPEQNDEGETIALQRIQDGFTLLDATINKQFWKKRLRFTIGAKNILNIRQVNVTGGGGGAHSGNSGTLPIGLGRSFFVNGVLNFGW